MQNKTEIKFLDVGCKIGGSFSIAKKYGFTSDQGIGIEVNETHVEKFKKSGYNGIIASATNIPFPDRHFELVIFSHVLEHMRGPEQGQKALNECIRVSSKLVVVALPFFDEDAYINSLGLKTFYSDWTGHTNKVHYKTLTSEWLKEYKYEVNMIKKIESSESEEIIPITAPTDSLEYDLSLHGEKPAINFDRDIWREYTIVIQK
jgi:ubiquinone/menaquinone biosynthesis C-methylase UbiE